MQKPQIGLPPHKGRGLRPTKIRILPGQPKPQSVSKIAKSGHLTWKPDVIAEGAKGPIINDGRYGNRRFSRAEILPVAGCTLEASIPRARRATINHGLPQQNAKPVQPVKRRLNRLNRAIVIYRVILITKKPTCGRRIKMLSSLPESAAASAFRKSLRELISW